MTDKQKEYLREVAMSGFIAVLGAGGGAITSLAVIRERIAHLDERMRAQQDHVDKSAEQTRREFDAHKEDSCKMLNAIDKRFDEVRSDIKELRQVFLTEKR